MKKAFATAQEETLLSPVTTMSSSQLQVEGCSDWMESMLGLYQMGTMLSLLSGSDSMKLEVQSVTKEHLAWGHLSNSPLMPLPSSGKASVTSLLLPPVLMTVSPLTAYCQLEQSGHGPGKSHISFDLMPSLKSKGMAVSDPTVAYTMMSMTMPPLTSPMMLCHYTASSSNMLVDDQLSSPPPWMAIDLWGRDISEHRKHSSTAASTVRPDCLASKDQQVPASPVLVMDQDITTQAETQQSALMRHFLASMQVLAHQATQSAPTTATGNANFTPGGNAGPDHLQTLDKWLDRVDLQVEDTADLQAEGMEDPQEEVTGGGLGAGMGTLHCGTTLGGVYMKREVKGEAQMWYISQAEWVQNDLTQDWVSFFQGMVEFLGLMWVTERQQELSAMRY
ncbi:hypothetical protein FRB94_013371 [Tulasnella sp. JGI-2019a]|nr:hypothetical protein FRB93_007978 [Tulasnella sp. JGI-2019a]KAG8990421.1 hypothetical protein FRB94_013371 [Tulasnella sp. JGI-2019a]